MSNHDLTKYKKSKIIVRELETLLNIVNLSINGLTPFRKYHSIPETLMCLHDNKAILEIHLEHNRTIIKNKGSVVNES